MPGQDNTINGPESARRMQELLAQTMVSDPVQVQASIAEHEADACPFGELVKQDGAMVPFHGPACRYAMAVRENWQREQMVGLSKAVDALGDRLRVLNTRPAESE